MTDSAVNKLLHGLAQLERGRQRARDDGPELPAAELLEVATREELAALQADTALWPRLVPVLVARHGRLESGVLLRFATGEERAEWRRCDVAIRESPDLGVTAAHGRLRRLAEELERRFVAASEPADSSNGGSG